MKFTDIRPGFVRTPLLDGKRAYPMEMSIDYAAPRIELAILQCRRVAVIDNRWRMPQCLWKHISLDI